MPDLSTSEELDLLLTRGGPSSLGETRTIVIEDGGQKLTCEYVKGVGIEHMSVECVPDRGTRIHVLPFADPDQFSIID